MRKTLLIALLVVTMLCTFTARANEPPQDVEWKIENGVLTIFGEGAMQDYANISEIPWYTQKDKITKIVVNEGITRIGNLAFYGLTNATEAILPQSLKETGISAFSYTEGTKTSIGNPLSDFLFAVESDKSVVSNGDEFTVSICLTGDFKDLSAIESVLLFDTKRVSIDENNIFDEEWLKTIGQDNLGYISEPLGGIVANNVRLAYVSLTGTTIDGKSPLYNKGKTTLTIAKIKCRAISDIVNVDDSCFLIQNSLVLKNGDTTPTVSESQLTRITSLPMKQLTIKHNESPKTEEGANSPSKPREITVIANGKRVYYDTPIYRDSSGSIMIPLRHTMQAIGGVVSWESETRTVFSVLKTKAVAMQIGGNTVFCDGETFEITPAPVIRDSRTLVPLDTIDRAFGTKTTYDEKTATITITN